MKHLLIVVAVACAQSSARVHTLSEQQASRVFYIAAAQASLLSNPSAVGRLVILERFRSLFADTVSLSTLSDSIASAWRAHFLRSISGFNRQRRGRSTKPVDATRLDSLRDGWLAALTPVRDDKLFAHSADQFRAFALGSKASLSDLFAFSSKVLSEIETRSVTDDQYKYTVTSVFEEPAPGASVASNTAALLARLQGVDALSARARAVIKKLSQEENASIALSLDTLIAELSQLQSAVLTSLDKHVELAPGQLEAYLSAVIFISSLISYFDLTAALTSSHIIDATEQLAVLAPAHGDERERLDAFARSVAALGAIEKTASRDTKAERSITNELSRIASRVRATVLRFSQAASRAGLATKEQIDSLTASVHAQDNSRAYQAGQQIVDNLNDVFLSSGQVSHTQKWHSEESQYCFRQGSTLTQDDLSYCLWLFEKQIERHSNDVDAAGMLLPGVTIGEWLAAVSPLDQTLTHPEQLSFLAKAFSKQKHFEPVTTGILSSVIRAMFRFAERYPQSASRVHADWARTLAVARRSLNGSASVLSEHRRITSQNYNDSIIHSLTEQYRLTTKTLQNAAGPRSFSLEQSTRSVKPLVRAIEAFTAYAIPSAWQDSASVHSYFHGSSQLSGHSEDRLNAFEAELRSRLAVEPEAIAMLDHIDRLLEMLGAWVNKDAKPLPVAEVVALLSAEVTRFVENR